MWKPLSSIEAVGYFAAGCLTSAMSQDPHTRRTALVAIRSALYCHNPSPEAADGLPRESEFNDVILRAALSPAHLATYRLDWAKLLTQPDKKVRALRSLLDHNCAALKELKGWQRTEAFRCLESMGADAASAIPALEQALGHKDANIRRAAKQALDGIRGAVKAKAP